MTNGINSLLKDNRERGSVGEFLKQNISEGTKMSVVSAYFTIYAYEKLKGELDSIDSMRFLFGDPKFIKKTDEDKEYKAFALDNEDKTFTIKQQLMQKYLSILCSEWIKEKVEILLKVTM